AGTIQLPTPFENADAAPCFIPNMGDTPLARTAGQTPAANADSTLTPAVNPRTINCGVTSSGGGWPIEASIATSDFAAAQPSVRPATRPHSARRATSLKT